MWCAHTLDVQTCKRCWPKQLNGTISCTYWYLRNYNINLITMPWMFFKKTTELPRFPRFPPLRFLPKPPKPTKPLRRGKKPGKTRRGSEEWKTSLLFHRPRIDGGKPGRLRLLGRAGNGPVQVNISKNAQKWSKMQHLYKPWQEFVSFQGNDHLKTKCFQPWSAVSISIQFTEKCFKNQQNVPLQKGNLMKCVSIITCPAIYDVMCTKTHKEFFFQAVHTATCACHFYSCNSIPIPSKKKMPMRRCRFSFGVVFIYWQLRISVPFPNAQVVPRCMPWETLQTTWPLRTTATWAPTSCFLDLGAVESEKCPEVYQIWVRPKGSMYGIFIPTVGWFLW